MTNLSSDGEVFGSKALTIAVIALSALILAGTIYSPGGQQAPNAQTTQTQQIVDQTHSSASGVSG